MPRRVRKRSLNSPVPLPPEMSRVQQAIQRHEAAGTLEDPEYHEAIDTFT